MCSLVPRLIPKLIWEQDIGTEKMSAGTSSPPRNFCERLPALCVLSSFIDEHEQWIDSLLQQLGWQKQSLSTKVMNHRRDIRPLQINYLFLIPPLGESTCGRAVPEVLIN